MPRDRSQLRFPLDPNALFSLLKGSFIKVGAVTLASGAATIADRRIKPTSIAILTYGGTTSSPGTLKATCTSSQLAIASSSGSDASIVNYLIVL